MIVCVCVCEQGLPGECGNSNENIINTSEDVRIVWEMTATLESQVIKNALSVLSNWAVIDGSRKLGTFLLLLSLR